jgi:hypothetical protein
MDHLEESGAVFCRCIGELHNTVWAKVQQFKRHSSYNHTKISETALQSDSLSPRLHTFLYISVVYIPPSEPIKARQTLLKPLLYGPKPYQHQ